MGGELILILLDTHTLLFWIKGDSLLPKKRMVELEKLGGEKVFICSLSFWEIYIKEKKGKLDLGEDPGSFTKKVVGSGKVTIIDPSWKDFLIASQFAWNHSDPVDRTLVAIAKSRSLKLLSKDSEITKFYKKTIWK